MSNSNGPTVWEQKNKSKDLKTSGPSGKKGTEFTESNLLKAGLVIAGGIIIAALAKGVKDSDYFD